MRTDYVADEYFEWMLNLVCGKPYTRRASSHKKLLTYLHDVEFIFINPNDRNRAEDGLDLRYRFGIESGYGDISNILIGSCSVLEMLVSLSIRCEEGIADDPDIGNRTGKWFWDMIENLGLDSMNNLDFDLNYTKNVLNRFLNREYKPDGTGGLFTIKNCKYDLRTVEIWYQLLWYLNNNL